MEGYTVHFKSAGLRRIFTGAAARYNEECREKVEQVVHEEAPKDLVAGISGRPQAWNMSGTLTDSLRGKLLALPFVARIETNDETKARLDKTRGPVAAAGKKIKGWAQDIIYRR
ncbi:MAG: hypothetical protein GC185_03945 [Alphaproteobacteria bacterium]|nr:hypothetical protein [Alphaproteobacteria bacterium]